MKIIIFGATGGTGIQLAKLALNKGYTVTAFVRDVGRMPFSHKNLALFQGSALNPAQVELAVKNHGAVISALGSPLGSRRPTSPVVCSEGTSNIIKAMERYGIKRLVAESAYGVYKPNESFYTWLLWKLAKKNMQDKERMENVMRSSAVEWVAVRPVQLTNGSKTGRYRCGENIKTDFWWPTVSRADVADFMIKQLAEDRFIRRAPAISL